MVTTDPTNPSLRRAVAFMSLSSMIVPLAGIVTSPVLAQGLGVEGRGVVAAAMAPNVLLVSVATLGLPEALTYYLAKYPWATARALWWSCLAGGMLAVGCVVLTVALAPTLGGGDVHLVGLIKLAAALAIPQLLVNLLRGAAAGRQMWGTIAAEKITNSMLRVVVLLALLISGHLTVTSAVLTVALGPIMAGLVYWRLVTRPPAASEADAGVRLSTALVTYGSRVWLGAVASMLLARLGQVLFVPLSNVTELGLYVVGITISDVPIIVSLAVRDALFGVNSKERDARALGAVCRITLLMALLVSLLIGATLPWWIGLTFGEGFADAVPLTWVLLCCAVFNIPGFLVAAGLSAWGRPGLRSIGLALTVIVDVSMFVLLVPRHGAMGAAGANAASSLFSSVFMVLCASRAMGVSPRSLVLVTRDDLRGLVSETTRFARRALGRRGMKKASR